MRYLFTLLLLMTFSFLSAQDLTLNITEAQLAAGEYLDYGEVIITNNGTSSVELAFRLEQVCWVDGDGTEIQVCVGALCFIAVHETTTWGADEPTALLVLEPGESSDILKFQALPIGNHESEWNLVVFDRNNPDNSATLNVTFVDDLLESCVATSTTDFAYEIGRAFPNPATEIINIPYEVEANNAQLLIYNAVGQQVQSVEVDPQNESVNVDVSELSQGVYYYHITDGTDLSKMLSFVK